MHRQQSAAAAAIAAAGVAAFSSKAGENSGHACPDESETFI
jgi:hypothetical protein